MEGTFRNFQLRRGARQAYVEAEVVTSLAHQIRGIRTMRGWSQKDLAKQLETTQASVSRFEDPSYGKLTMKSLFELAAAFDVGLEVRFVSLVTMLHQTYVPNPDLRKVPSFEEEAPHVGFFTPGAQPFMSVPTLTPAAATTSFYLPLPKATQSALFAKTLTGLHHSLKSELQTINVP